MGNTDTQESPRPGLGRNHHLPPYSILCTSPQSPHSNGFLSQDSQVGVPKSPRLGLPRLWGAITLRANLGLKWGLKQSCSPRRELFNGVSHAMCTHRNRVHSRLLVVGSQTANLTLDLSFGHNLCFKCPNGRCELILDIFIPIAFHWYKERLNPLSFDAYNRPLKIWESIGTPTPKVELPWGVRVHSLTPSHTPGSMLCDSRLPSLARNLANPCLSHKPKAKVTTRTLLFHESSNLNPSFFRNKTNNTCGPIGDIQHIQFAANEKGNIFNLKCMLFPPCQAQFVIDVFK